MQEQKRILIVSTMFFPEPNVATVRVTQWCRFLPEFNWQPTILCRYYGHMVTPQLLAEKVHPEVKVEYLNPPQQNEDRTTISRQQKQSWKLSVSKSAIGQWIVPDASIKFWRDVRPKVLELAQRVQPDIILTTSPPHSIHDLGLWLSKQIKVPWVADFRDPYLIYNRLPPRVIDRLRWAARKEYERRIYDHADLIIHATPIHERWARRVYPTARQRIVAIYNGFPPELVEGPNPRKSNNDRQSIRVIGFMGSLEVRRLIEATEILLQSGMDLELRLTGKLPDDLQAIPGNLGDRLVINGVVQHDHALREIGGATVLVCMADYQRSNLVGLSTKMFEYIATGKPVVVINPKIPDRQLARKLKGVCMLSMPTTEELAKALRMSLDPASKPPVEQAIAFREKYNRRTQAAQLASWLDQVVGVDPPQQHGRAGPVSD